MIGRLVGTTKQEGQALDKEGLVGDDIGFLVADLNKNKEKLETFTARCASVYFAASEAACLICHIPLS